MIDEKSWYESRAIWGAIVVMGAQVASIAGYEVDASAVTDIVLSAVSIVGAGLAWWGRVAATKPIRRRAV